MKKILTVGIVPLVALVCLAGPAWSGETVELQFKPAEGAEFSYTLKSEQKSESDQWSSGSKISTDISVVVSSVTDGAAKLTLTAKNFKASGESARSDWDSESNADYSLEGQEFKVTVSRDGKTQSESIEVSSGGDRRRGWIRRGLASPIQEIAVLLPSKAVEVGESWEAESELPRTGRWLRGLDFPLKVSSTLASVEEVNGIKCAKIVQKMYGKVEDQEVGGGNFEATVNEMVFDGEITAYVAVDGGHVVKLTAKSTTESDIESDRGKWQSKTTRTRTLELK